MIKRQAAATDAAVKFVGQGLQRLDPRGNPDAKPGCDPFPVLPVRGAVGRQAGQVTGNLCQGETQTLGDQREGQASQVGLAIPSMTARIAQGADDAMRFVKPDGRDGQPGSSGKVADGQALGQAEIPLDLKLT